MNAAPPRLIENIAGLLIPPACRESVLGDLHERYTSDAQYIADAMCTVPLVILSRIRRTTDVIVLLMEAFVLCISYGAAILYFDKTLLEDQFEMLRLAIPWSVALIALVLGDAYDNRRTWWPLKPILGAALGMGFAFLAEGVVSAANSELAIPRSIMIAGGAISLLLISTLRMLFPPLGDQPQGVTGPAFWQKQSVDAVSLEEIRRGIRALREGISRQNESRYWVAILLAVVILFVAHQLRK